MDRNIQKIGLINWILLLVATATAVAVAQITGSIAAWVGAMILGVGLVVALVCYFQMRLENREALEKLEFDELNRAKNSAALFSQAESETFPARRSREQFERFFVPGFSVILLFLQIGIVFCEWRFLEKDANPVAAGHAAVGVSVFGLLWLILFLLGKYSSSLARIEGHRLLRPAASYLMLGCYVCLLLAVDIGVVVWGGVPQADRYMARALAAIVSFVALETLVGLVLEIYRPRVKGKQGRLLYDSRLVGLLGEPEGVFSTAAHALDYQFGFKVSETWFYRFFEKALVWIILAQLFLLLLSTCIVFIEPGEQALLERFGRQVASRAILNPGPHLKLPWPIEQVRRFTTSGLQTFSIGFVHDEKRQNETTVLWNVSHYKEEFNLLVASRDQASPADAEAGTTAVPVNLLTVSIPVQYQIKDLRAWATNYAAADKVLENVATREVVRYLVGVDINEIMSAGRISAAQALQDRIQQRADDLKLGVNILFVGLQDIHPPVKVADAYQAVIGAQQQIQTNILAAEGYKLRTVPLAEAEAIRRVRQAEAYKMTRVAASLARAAQFTNQLTAFNASPRVYGQRMYLQTFARASVGARKYIVAPTNTHDVMQLNLEDKIRTDLGDITLPKK